MNDTPIDELELSVRAHNCLKRAGINTIGQLEEMIFEKLKDVRNLGVKCAKQVVRDMNAKGYHIKNEDSEDLLTKSQRYLQQKREMEQIMRKAEKRLLLELFETFNHWGSLCYENGMSFCVWFAKMKQTVGWNAFRYNAPAFADIVNRCTLDFIYDYYKDEFKEAYEKIRLEAESAKEEK